MMKHGMVIFKVHDKFVCGAVEDWVGATEYFYPPILSNNSERMYQILSGSHMVKIMKNRYGYTGMMNALAIDILPEDFYILVRGRPGLHLSTLHEKFEENEYAQYHKLLPMNMKMVSPEMLVDFVYSVSI